ncbi:hypothetical protein A2631_00825 [Candidatus Daviesbacteria bacterium RIFCSPHIGHO2_01_FULL_44_29]|uniref:PDZ domain-containing protein n=1 Tax=Candidatus Daviesbacteria bacterium RIFCSPHIGHO2_02_FULL_43_12 TaxID=1797776 RepID=A0A1F5KH48_9BACT|nr:MAG: hypothetical protein A2631_00825 [Candidatus Daviesbacteria bacterium RIFCSPHIGHO2_01_FULL_44_29]OGE39384.1 MAG: hypothetical protein A3E86_01685 [Candidatus Daviesbacteria bacterium RIFCSPHIGHO2_12_FULL_47_45]OGE40263.1 MAG: hypothetical protein A3D25_05290 [Candidatus Daviesbacteria bacterium RIFCSPHIGHO2_02_FULL_43_12]OGE69062.1 MAG: hypothetical protein A3B55_02370 [Candidatus Daviesbacteria bacterium RIFCSPLOWO2_01_FULL_43_15]
MTDLKGHLKLKIQKTISALNSLTVTLVLIALIIGWMLGQRDLRLQLDGSRPQITFTHQTPSGSATNIDFKLFWDTWDLVSREYVDKKAIDSTKMFYGAIKGMVEAVGDPYTVFLPPESQKSTKEELGGSFEGVGLQLGFNKEKRLAVIAPLSGTPADKAGIKPGDLILKINTTDSINMSLPDAVNMIRGVKGSQVDLEIYHDGDDKTRVVTLTRDTIIVKSVEYQSKTTPLGKKVGLIKLSRFGEKTSGEWVEAVSMALAGNPAAIVLDLRNNPGGFLDGAVFIGSEFISSGDIVLQENAAGERQGYKVNRVGKLTNIPVIVLINKGSASASEIVAGALQDLKKAKLVGDQSFGKGTIQESQELPGGTGIHITTAKWLTPLGRWIHGTGLTPDVVVVLGDDQTKDAQLDKALELLD